MKFAIIALAVFGSASSAFAAAECPQGTTKSYACVLTPQEGDSAAVSEKVHSIAVCRNEARDVSLVLEANNLAATLSVEVDNSRPGGVTYKFDSTYASATFGHPVALGPDVSKTYGKLDLTVSGKALGKSTYTCDIIR